MITEIRIHKIFEDGTEYVKSFKIPVIKMYKN